MERIVKYKEEDMNRIMGELDKLEVKGINNMNSVLGIVQTLQSPVEIVEEDIAVEED